MALEDRISINSILSTCTNLNIFENLFSLSEVRDNNEAKIILFITRFNYELSYCLDSYTQEEIDAKKEEYQSFLENLCSC